MEPELNIGDIVISKNVKEDEIKEADIISFREKETIITHRITEIIDTKTEKKYKTKGDNNNTEDSGTITYNLIEGKVIKKIPKLGKISLLLQNRIIIIMVIVILYLYIMQKYSVYRKKNERKMKRLMYENKK